MELGMIGLGRMGTNMMRRLMRFGHRCVVYDLHPEAVRVLVKEGAVGTTSLEDFAHKLKEPRAAWMMVPAAAVDPTLNALVPLLEPDDVVIDEAVPAPVLSAALYERFGSRGEADFANQVLSALRYEFGGHEEKAAAPQGGA